MVFVVPMLEKSFNVYDDSRSFLCYNSISKRMKKSDTTGLRIFNFLNTTDVHLVESYLLFLILLEIKYIEWKMSHRMKREGLYKCPP